MGQKSAGVMMLLLAITVGVTIAVGFLLVESSAREGVFFLSLGGMVLAEVIFAGYPIRQVLSQKNNRSAVPHEAGTQFVLGVYLFGTFAAAGAAAAGVSFNILAVIHLVLLLGAVVFGGLFGLASGHADKLDKNIQAERGPMQAMRNRFEAIVDKITLMDGPEVASLRPHFDKAKEALRFSSSESLQGIANLDAELETQIAQVESKVDTLEQNTGQQSEEDDTSLSDAVHETDKDLTRLEQVVRRRDEELMRLRSST